MKNVFFMKKWNLTWKNVVESHFLMKIWKLEDQYTIIFLLALFPEEPREIHFFEKSLEHVGFNFRKIIEKCTKWLQNEDLGVPIPGIRTKFRSESNGDGPGPPNPGFRAEIYKNSRYTAPWRKLCYLRGILGAYLKGILGECLWGILKACLRAGGVP